MVNIILITKNRTNLLRQAVFSLRDNTDPSLYNLSIIDDGGLDRQVQDVLIGKENEVILRISDSKGIVGLVRNIGADFATRYWGRGEWVLFLDNDVYLHPGWLGAMKWCLMRSPSLKIIGGCRHPFHQPNETHYIRASSSSTPPPPGPTVHVEETDAVAGYSMLMSWETWDDYGPFDQHAKGLGQSEDFAICQKVIKDGFRVGYVSPPVLTVTGLTNTLGEKVPGWEQLRAMVPKGVIAE